MNVIGIDLGGTKVAAALVNSKGKILGERKVATALEGGWGGLKKQLVQICRELIADYGRARAIGVGSAGPLHAPSGRLLDPTNFGWPAAVVPLGKSLSAALKLPVLLENDAAAAVLAEHWKGGGGKNCVVITLGTGVGVGVMINGRLLRGGRGLHPEVGHLVLRPGDKTALCGCGVLGCAEAFLSGMNFGKRAGAAMARPGITGKEVAELAAEGDAKALTLFAEYSDLLATYLLDLVVLYYPEQIIFTGSFAEASPLFLPATETKLKKLLERRVKTIPLYPKIRISRLGNQAGILGAAYIALNKNYAEF
jgi:glucokinase